MFYKNISLSVKTFYGVEFKPGEIHEVPGYINSPDLAAVEKPAEPPKPHVKSEPADDTSTESTNKKIKEQNKEEKS